MSAPFAGGFLHWFGTQLLAQSVIEPWVALLETFGDAEILGFYFSQVDLLDVDYAQQFAYRPRHIAAALIARTAALCYPDTAPEILLIHAQLAANVTRISNLFEQLHVAPPAVNIELTYELHRGFRPRNIFLSLLCEICITCGYMQPNAGRWAQAIFRHGAAACRGAART